MKTKGFDTTTLKNLSIKECIGLAKFLYPKFTWFYHHPYPDDEWDGHDIASGKCHTVTGYHTTLRIDYRDQVSTETPRIIFKQTGGITEVPDTNKIIDYLIQIGKL
jgi:hypothetical protein